MKNIETRIRFTVDVVVPVEMKEGDLLYDHGVNNFIYYTYKELVEQLKVSVASQVEEQHAALLADARHFWQIQRELLMMLNLPNSSTPYLSFDLARANLISTEIQAILRRFGMEVEDYDGDLHVLSDALRAVEARGQG